MTTVNEAKEANEGSGEVLGEETGQTGGETQGKEDLKGSAGLSVAELSSLCVESKENGLSEEAVGGMGVEGGEKLSVGSAGGSLGGSSLFSFKKPKLKSASINREFLSKASHSGGKGVGAVPVGPRGVSVLGSGGKPRLTTKISTTSSSYGFNTFSDGMFPKSLDGKTGGVAGGTLSSALGAGVARGGPVWGRNKKPDVREYTDEELSSVHGIRLVRRLSAQSDEDKAGKWDEMDDDATDWSDTIEFADGTKFALPHDDHSTVSGTNGIESTWTPTWEQTQDSRTMEGSAEVNNRTGGIESSSPSNASGGTSSFRVVSKEEHFREENYDRSWNSQKPGMPQIYNVNTGKFDVVDGMTKNDKKGCRRVNSENKPRAGYPILLLSRHNTANHVKKEETHEIHEQKSAKSSDISDNDTKKKSSETSKAALKTESKEVEVESANTHSSVQLLVSSKGTMNSVKSAFSQPVQTIDPAIDDIETFQRAIMIEAKEKARLRREEEEMGRRMQQERARKKAEELAKLAQKSESVEISSSKEEKKHSIISKNLDIHSTTTSNILTNTSLTSSQQVSSVSACEPKMSSKPTEKKKDKRDSSQSYKNIIKSNKPESGVSMAQLSGVDTQTHNNSKLELKKDLSTASSELYTSNKKEEKTTELHKHHTHIDPKQKHLKASHTNNHCNIHDNWRRERININEKEQNKSWTPLNNIESQKYSLNAQNMSFLSLEKKKSSVSTTNKSSNKSNPSHSRTSSRFFPVAAHTELVTQPIDTNKLGKNKNNSSASGHREKQDISLLSKPSLNDSTHSVQTNNPDIKSSSVILPTSSQISQTIPTHSSKRSSNANAVSITSAATLTPATSVSTTSTVSSTSLVARPGSSVSQSTRHHVRSSTRSFDDVMEQLAKAGNFAQNNEKFASYLSSSKILQNHIENDTFSATTVSSFELEKCPKNTTNISLHSLNNSNELFDITVRPFANENDTKPFVNIPPASSYVFAIHQYPVERSKYFETPYEHTIDFTLYDDQEIDTLRLYLPETSPKHIKIKSSSTFLHRKSSENTQLHVYNTFSS